MRHGPSAVAPSPVGAPGTTAATVDEVGYGGDAVTAGGEGSGVVEGEVLDDAAVVDRGGIEVADNDGLALVNGRRNS